MVAFTPDSGRRWNEFWRPLDNGNAVSGAKGVAVNASYSNETVALGGTLSEVFVFRVAGFAPEKRLDDHLGGKEHVGTNVLSNSRRRSPRVCHLRLSIERLSRAVYSWLPGTARLTARQGFFRGSKCWPIGCIGADATAHRHRAGLHKGPEHFPIIDSITAAYEEVPAFFVRECRANVGDRVVEASLVRTPSLRRMLFSWRRTFDRVEVWRVGRSKKKRCAGRADGVLDAATLWREIVHQDDVAGPQTGATACST